MAERAYWKGHIRLSLVTFPVTLHAGVTNTQKIQLHKVNRSSGERVHYQDVSGADREKVEKQDIVKGYEYEDGQYIQIEDKELEKLKAESRHTIDLVQFCDMKDIDPVYYERPYFLVPDGELAQEAYVTLRDALRDTHKVALGQITLAGRERIAAIKACGDGLLLETMRYSDEIREASKYFDEVSDKIKVDKDQLQLAEQLIEAKSAKFDPKAFKDRYQAGLMEIIQAKLAHKPVKLDQGEKKPAKVVNIMDALKRSLAETQGKAPAKEPASKGAAKKQSGTKKPAAKPAAKKGKSRVA